MNVILFLLVLAVLAIAFVVYRARVNHTTLKAEKDKELAELKDFFAKEHEVLKAELVTLRAKMPGNHHWADAPAAGAAPVPPPEAPAGVS